MMKRIITFLLVLALVAGHLTTTAYASWLNLSLQKQAMQANSDDGLTYEDIQEFRKERAEARRAATQAAAQATNQAKTQAAARVQQSDIQGKWEFSIDMKPYLRDLIFDALQNSLEKSIPPEVKLSASTYFKDPVELKGTVFFKQNGEYEISVEQEAAYLDSAEKMARKIPEAAIPNIMAVELRKNGYDVKNPLKADSWKTAFGKSFEELWKEINGNNFETSVKEFANKFLLARRLGLCVASLQGTCKVQTNKLFYSYSTRNPITENSNYFTFTLDGKTLTITNCSEKSFFTDLGEHVSLLFPIGLKKVA